MIEDKKKEIFNRKGIIEALNEAGNPVDPNTNDKTEYKRQDGEKFNLPGIMEALKNAGKK